jgi:TolB-like protein
MAESRRSSVESLTSGQVAFGEYRFNPGTGELWRGDKEIKLTPRAATLLAVLAERATLVVTKQELVARAWQGRAIGDDALTSCVQELRRALGDDPRQPRLIETRHRRGYRLLVPVSAAELPAKSGTAAGQTAPLPLPDKPSIAVLPFQNMSGDPEQEYFADGVVDEIIMALSRFKSLLVIARNSSFAYKGKSPDIRQVGRELGVRYVLEGSVRKAGNRLRITAQLIDATSGAHSWADRFEGALEDVFAFQDEVTVKVVAAIAPRVIHAEVERARRRPPGNTDAYDCYLRGLSCLSKSSAEGVMEAMRLFTQASALDPDYAAAYGMTMNCHVNRMAFGLVEDIEHERTEVTRLWRIVMRIGQDDGVALSQAGWAVAYILRDLASAKRLIDRAVELNPNHARAWTNSGWVNVWLGHPDIALEHLDRAQRLDPGGTSTSSDSAVAHALFFLDRHEEAMGVAEQILQHNPDQHPSLRIGAASAALAGHSDVAYRLAAHLRSIDPAFAISKLRKQLGPYQKADFVEKYAQALRLAGVPE